MKPDKSWGKPPNNIIKYMIKSKKVVFDDIVGGRVKKFVGKIMYISIIIN
jgi:hypothetical protein